ncbi:MAG: amino acid permease [Actinomycetales bacterium]|nr:amino acid permease [Actinomycetales bacterium]
MSQRENLPKSDQVLGAPDTETPDTTLRRGTLGLAGIIFFVVAAAAPLAGMTGAFPVAVAIGNGAAAAGMYVAVGVILLLFSVGYATMSHYVTNTGAFFAYVGRGLGIVPGVGSAAVSVLAYLAVQWAVLGFLSFQMSYQFEAKFGISLPWWLYGIVLMIIVWALSALSVDIGAKVLGVFLTIELIALIVVGAAAIFDGGPDGPNFTASFSPNEIFAGGLIGGAGIAFSFALASYIGFEATAIYGEESKNPKRNVPLATYISVILITAIFAFVGFGLVTGLGATDIQNKVFEITAVDGVPLADPSAMLFGLTTQFVGSWLTELFGWIVLTSLFAALLAFQNSAARYLFSMGRAGVLTKKLDRTNSRQAPHVATTVVGILGIVLIVVGVIFNWDPILNIFYWFSAVAVIAIVFTEILVSLAVIVYFRRTKEDTRLWHTMIAPILAIIGLGIGEIMLMARFNLFAGTAPDPSMCPGDAGSGCGPFELNGLGWFLVLLPYLFFIIGLILGAVRRDKENYDAVHNFVS